MRPPRLPLLLGAVLCATPMAARLPAQAPRDPVAPAPAPSCEGLTVSRIDIRPGRPPYAGSASRWRHFARAVGLHHATTREGVIEAFLQLHVGQPCTEERRRESERLLRDQPYIADARLTATPDGQGGVAILVETVDEVPVLVGGQIHGASLQSLSLGNANIGGQGLLGLGYYERGFGHRTGAGLRVIEYATFGRPYTTTLEAFRHPLGFYRNAELAHPFLTDFQRFAWHLRASDEEQYRGVSRAARDPLALRVPQQRWDASAITRLFGTGTVTLLGVGASGIRISPDRQGIVVVDTGLVADSGTALVDRYQPFRAVRLGVLAGIRRLHFTTVQGFDGLFALQDVASGVMAGAFAAHGLPSAGESDRFLSGGLYGGAAGARVLLATAAQMEARQAPVTNAWDNMIGSGRAALYLKGAPGMLVLLDDRYSLGVNARLPLQLDLGDRVGGILGYRTASLAGARRNALRSEVRFSREALIHNADLGFAAFGENGRVWAGDVPYGVNATRSTLGFSLLGAYPTRSKRLYRVDVGFPLSRGGTGRGGIEVRFSSEDRSGAFWTEPDDVARARTGPVASTLFITPTAR